MRPAVVFFWDASNAGKRGPDGWQVLPGQTASVPTGSGVPLGLPELPLLCALAALCR